MSEQMFGRVPIRDLVALATRAPSVHNTQPWRWRITEDHLSLFADYSRKLTHADPEARDLIISCGAALQHLRVAAAASGWEAVVRRMPNPYNDAQLADISFRAHRPTNDQITALEALTRRRTDRRRPTFWPVPRDRLDPLAALGPAAGVTVVGVVSPTARSDLLHILAEAAKVQRLNPDYVDEIVHWTGRHDDQGIPTSSLPSVQPTIDGESVPPRFPSGTLADHPSLPVPVEPALLVICTSSDDTLSRLRAGEALGAMLVKGTSDGLAMVPLSQAIEVNRTRRLLQDELLHDAACPQIVLQVGWPPPITSQEVPLTPRRPLDEVIDDVA